MNKIISVLNNGKLMKRIGFTLLILFVFQLSTFIPIPLADTESLVKNMGDAGFFDFMNAFSGSALANFAITALGISPYITSSIVIQLLQMDIVPKFKEWSEQGEVGKQKLNQVTRYLAIALAFVNALVLLIGLSGNSTDLILRNDVVGKVSLPFAYIFMALVMTAGAAFVMWLADLITRHGVGNGSSMLIAYGILITLPSTNKALTDQFAVLGDGAAITKLVVIYVIYALVLLGVVFSQLSVRKIPIQYANRQNSKDSNIPMKINPSGVIPVIFAGTLLSIPTSILQICSSKGWISSDTGAGMWLTQIFSNTEPIGFVLYILLIFVFTFFYAFLTVNPEKMADNLSKQNAYIPGVKPGDDTNGFLARQLFKTTIIGSTALVILSIIPIIVSAIFGLSSNVTIGGTGLLIIVGVAIETLRQVETDAEEQNYSGFIK